MLILDYPDWNQPTLAQFLISEATYRLTPELEKIVKYLQDKSYEYPIVDRFNTQCGRPSVPARVYIHMMFLKHYTGLSYEDLPPKLLITSCIDFSVVSQLCRKYRILPP